MTIELQQELRGYGQWREQLVQTIDHYRSWLETYGLKVQEVDETLLNLRHNLQSERLVIAFAAEFSRGKTELINSLFFSDTGVRLLPSSPGRTTMCPTEIFYDEEGGSYIRLLPIESRLSDMTLGEYKQRPLSWMQVELDPSSPVQMQEAFQELAATKKVPFAQAQKLGLWNNDGLSSGLDDDTPETVEVPCWRHALISFPHPLLKEGLSIMDTPGLNALGAEPELTLTMLPSAHAVVFVLAADTGVTKSDLEMWRNHVRGTRRNRSKGLAVVMNKIDSMWGDLRGEEAIEQSLRGQILSTANILEVDERSVFPLSAKQALLAKVKGDNDLLEKSRLKALEDHLAELVVTSRQQMLHDAASQELNRLIGESHRLLEAQITDMSRQLNELKNLDLSNQDMTGKLMEETRLEQQRYLSSVDAFQAGRRVFVAQMKLLIDTVSPDRLDPIIKKTRKQMMTSLTTVGMKAAMKSILEEFRMTLERTSEAAEETRRLVKAIYGGFQDKHGFADVKPVLVSFKDYEFELERLFEEGEEFRHSASSTLMEQTLVVQKLYGTIISQGRAILAQAHKAATNWGATALNPLIRQIKDHKNMIESRLEVLRKINDSSESMDGEITKLEQSLKPLEEQFVALNAIRNVLVSMAPQADPEPAPPGASSQESAPKPHIRLVAG
ncbi:MAG: dynamin family protein [Methylococcaceae bacterium]|nr:dynamin family protein [Methylococcaceae bacterium]